MKKLLIVLALVTASAFAVDNLRVEGPQAGGSDDMLQYDDASPYWIVYNIPFYGTWYDVQDFMPSAIGFEADAIEMWFYHHSLVPWDTDDISMELWNGDSFGPMTQVDASDITAVHYTPTVYNYGTSIIVEQNFWLIANTEVYSGSMTPTGWYDQTDNFTGVAHTFSSGDFILWDPITVSSIDIDALFRVEGDFQYSLESESWGAIKGLYR